MRHRGRIIVPAVLSAAVLQAVGGAAWGADYHLERIAPVLNQPTYLTQAPGDPANLLYYSNRISTATSGFSPNPVNTMGKIWKYDTVSRVSTPIVDFSSRNVYNDDGLQTFAFHPDFNMVGAEGYGKIYASTAEYVGPPGPSPSPSGLVVPVNRVEEFTILNPDGTPKSATDAFATRRLIVQYNNSSQNNHTIDWVGFDPNAAGVERNYLYISTGDGSYGNGYNDASGVDGRPSQNPADLKGKILRVDISPASGDAYPLDVNKNFAIPDTNPIVVYNAAHPGTPILGVADNNVPASALGEVWVTGVRNGYRVSFDRLQSDFWIGDVGETSWEEVDFIKAGSNVNIPVDLGWPQLEGVANGIGSAPHTQVNPFTGVTSLKPLQVYSHGSAAASIGGYMYRGPISELQGLYLHADYVTGKMWLLQFDRDTDPATFNANNGSNIDVTNLLNGLIMDPTDKFYRGDLSANTFAGIDHIVSFAEDNLGNVYVIDFSYGTSFDPGQYRANAGEIFKIVSGGINTVPTAYWTGSQGTSWAARAGNDDVSFNTTAASGINIKAYPNAGTALTFGAANAANFNTVLQADTFLRSLTITTGTPAVTIGTGTSGTYTLMLLGEGISVENGATLNLGVNMIGSVTINGGILNATLGTAPSLTVGNSGGNASKLVINSGTLTTASELWIGNFAHSYGYFEMNGGVATLGSNFAVARGSAAGQQNMRGVVTINNGSLSIGGTSFIVVGSFQGTATELDAVMTLNGGTVATNNGRFRIAESMGAVVTVNNNAVVNIVSTVGIEFTTNANTVGILNLNGGQITATRLQIINATVGGRTSVVNFNGGTLGAGASAGATPFIQGLTAAYVRQGGAFINDNGQSITIGQPLLAPTGSGVATIPTSGTIGGYMGPPVIHITGGGGTGATAIANVDAGGVLQSITITNPGVGYTGTPTVAPYGGGKFGSITLTGATLAPNVAGGLTKLGTGSLTLAGIATYGGPTAVNAGSLIFNTSSGVSSQIGTVSGAGNFVVSAGSVVTSNGVTLGGAWTINGTQHIRTGAGTAGTSKVTNLPTIANTVNGTNVTFTGTLNLADSIFIVQTTSAGDKTSKVSALNARISSGANGALWNGTGITSSVAQGDPNALGVGVFDNAVLGKTSYGGKDVDTSSLFVAVAHLGDTNRDGIVDIQDLGIIANNWQQSRTTWTAGDLNRDGFVDIQDLGILANNWQQSSTFFLAAEGLSNLSPPILDLAALNALTVPEPGTLGALAMSVLLLGHRMRRQRAPR